MFFCIARCAIGSCGSKILMSKTLAMLRDRQMQLAILHQEEMHSTDMDLAEARNHPIKQGLES